MKIEQLLKKIHALSAKAKTPVYPVGGFVRDYILAGTFGAGDTLDAYTSAFLVPDMLLQLLILGALSASFIPIFSKYYGIDDEKAWKFTNTILNVFGCIFVVVVYNNISFLIPLYLIFPVIFI